MVYDGKKQTTTCRRERRKTAGRGRGRSANVRLTPPVAVAVCVRKTSWRRCAAQSAAVVFCSGAVVADGCTYGSNVQCCVCMRSFIKCIAATKCVSDGPAEGENRRTAPRLRFIEVCSAAADVRVRANTGRSDARVCAYHEPVAGAHLVVFLYDFTIIQYYRRRRRRVRVHSAEWGAKTHVLPAVRTDRDATFAGRPVGARALRSARRVRAFS